MPIPPTCTPRESIEQHTDVSIYSLGRGRLVFVEVDRFVTFRSKNVLTIFQVRVLFLQNVKSIVLSLMRECIIHTRSRPTIRVPIRDPSVLSSARVDHPHVLSSQSSSSEGRSSFVSVARKDRPHVSHFRSAGSHMSDLSTSFWKKHQKVSITVCSTSHRRICGQ